MADLIYLTIKGKNQGLISAGCSSIDSIGNKYQVNHQDEILVYGLSHSMLRKKNVKHQPVIIRKPIDKSTPLLGVAISNNEVMDCFINHYRTSLNGGLELYFNLKLIGAQILEYSVLHPNSLENNDQQPQETLSLIYKSITWNHIIAGTGGYSIWEDTVY
ncbi:type VI secretion system tube protein Hcp [Photorhabdus laumondii subsp. laumondii]|uniref:Photorhabdus luminescens subsp. laumondii TTO1 complete genome segment 11/17 n=3 Tax=Photorhabdus TaxID=29487 RepID=Q7N2D1_PHOLL|nr:MULTISPECIES: Hcp family type VI secretion system effector [Photorhabdus]AWK42851.1 type VI secretion system protein [Photorhabdus laumondii subsp. laumondii]AXG43624.1 type VI secretion system tube protein Hcp [Photorhabdus laumondii subsp. laumondii]AXG48167.1 type VI secretion system tube protein Hcp [Photorhabdus laumondii subsp. laumondii]EYU15253.1 type VI secretion system effector, Hcp1 family [Photorhabdus aegyptia]KTL61248.1 type VI secretion system protein [Photorhabdus laumondii 